MTADDVADEHKPVVALSQALQSSRAVALDGFAGSLGSTDIDARERSELAAVFARVVEVIAPYAKAGGLDLTTSGVSCMLENALVDAYALGRQRGKWELP